MASNKEFWDWSVVAYDYWHNLEMQSYEAVSNDIISLIKPNDNILELACGTGIMSNIIVNNTLTNFNYIATDFSSKMIEICKNKTNKIKFEIADATNLDYANNYFDKVLIANALHIMPEPHKAIKEIKRVLKDDGLLIAPNFLTPTTLKEKIILEITRKLGYKVFN